MFSSHAGQSSSSLLPEDEEALLVDEFEVFRARAYSGGEDLLSPLPSSIDHDDGSSVTQVDSSSGVSCDSSPNIQTHRKGIGLSFAKGSQVEETASAPSASSLSSSSSMNLMNLKHPRMRRLKLRKSKSDRDIFSEIRKLKGWSRKEECDEQTSPEGDEVNVCLLEETGDNSSTCSSIRGDFTSSSNANNVSIDSACDPDFEVLAACKYKRAQMVRMVSTADSGIDIQITGPSPVHRPKIGTSVSHGNFRRAFSCKGRSSSLYLGDSMNSSRLSVDSMSKSTRTRHLSHSSSLPAKHLPQALSDNHLEQTDSGKAGYEIYRVRSFSTTADNAIINRGDSFKIKPAAARAEKRRNQCLRAAIRRSYFSSDCIVEQTASSDTNSLAPPFADNRAVSMDRLYMDEFDNEIYNDAYEEEDPEIPVYRVAVLGSHGVGKTTITKQLLTSEYLQNADPGGTEDDLEERKVTVLLDDEETILQFIDMAGEETNQAHDYVDAYIVVYSVTDRNSFGYAHACLQDIRGDKFSNAVVILVANKQDLVRNKVVTEEEGKALAVKCDCKYTEVSAILDHKVPELLVGIVRQIRLHRIRQSSDNNETSGDLLRYTGCLQRAAFELFRRFFRRHISSTSKSCDNLLIA